jgi:hypothetical protein
VEWINGYKKTTLAFWLDEDDVSFEQLAAFIALFTGVIYFLFKIEYGNGPPRVDPKSYLFIVVFLYVLLYYLTGGVKWIHSTISFKYVRLVMLHIVLSLLFISSLITLKIDFSMQEVDCGIANIVSTCLLFLQTRRNYKEYNKIHVAISSISLFIVGFLSIYFLILPSTG